MSAAVPTAAARAMALQLDRVNNSPAALRQRLDDATATIERLQDMIRDLRARLAAYEDSGSPAEPPTGGIYNGRPFITADAAARGTGLSLATVNRYLNSGYWAGDRPDGYHWIVYTDQPLHGKSGQRK